MHVRNITGLPAVLDKFDDFARQTVVRAMAEAGITVVAGSFEKGAVVTSTDEGVYQESTGKVFSWFTDATITVPAGTTPQNFGGINATAWVDRADLTLRAELANNDGAGLIGSMSYAQLRSYSGSQTTVNVWGISSFFDGAAGQFKVNSSDTISADDGGTILVDSLGRRWYRVFSGTLDVRWFGAKADGVTDDTASINRAAALGGEIHLPSGSYLISSSINTTISGTKIIGSGVCNCKIYQSSSSSKVFNNTASKFYVEGVEVDYTVTPAEGAIAFYSSGADSRIKNIYVDKCYIGIQFDGASDQTADHFTIYNYVNAGVHFKAASGCYLDSFILNAISASNGINGGIYLSDQCEMPLVTNGDILNGVYSLYTTAATYAPGSRPAYGNFTNVYFDSAAAGSYIDKVVDFNFNGCWFSGGRSGVGYSGCNLGSTDSVSFVDTRFVNCGAHGANVSANAQRTLFSGCKALGNGQTTGTGVSHGFYFAPNTNSFQLLGCEAGNYLFIGVQGYGIYVDTGTSNIYTISDCNLVGNYTNSLFDGGTGVTKKIANNSGYLTSYQGSATLASGSSSVVVSHFLASTPSQSDIFLQPTVNLAVAGLSNVWVSAVTSTTFTISSNAPATANAYISFSARIKGS